MYDTGEAEALASIGTAHQNLCSKREKIKLGKKKDSGTARVTAFEFPGPPKPEW
jgi:hypothetical protein